MDEKLLRKLLARKTETDWLEFKGRWNLYDTNVNIVTVERDELIKDILGLANGNSSNVRKTKYLIVGADNAQFDDQTGMRVLYNVDYQVPTQSQIVQWVNSACIPSVVGLEFDPVEIDGKTLYVLTVPPTFELHETKRDLNAKGRFNQHAVFMRQDEHTVLASVRDGVTLQQLKSLYRREVINPSSVVLGAIIGALMALLFWQAGLKSQEIPTGLTGLVIRILILILGVFFGAQAGWIFQQLNSLRYDWRHLSLLQKILAAILYATITGTALWWLFFGYSG